MYKHKGCTYTGVIFHAIRGWGDGGGEACTSGECHFPTPHVEWKTVQVNMSHRGARQSLCDDYNQCCIIPTNLSRITRRGSIYLFSEGISDACPFRKSLFDLPQDVVHACSLSRMNISVLHYKQNNLVKKFVANTHLMNNSHAYILSTIIGTVSDPEGRSK